MSEGLAVFTFDRLEEVDEFGQILRLIAKHSVMHHWQAPKFKRVCKAFEYCWQLALQTEHVDVARHLLPVLESGAMKDPTKEVKARCTVWREREWRKNVHLQRTIAPVNYKHWEVRHFQQKLPSLAEKKELHNREHMLPAQPPPPDPPDPPDPPPPCGDKEEELALMQATLQSKITVVQAKLSQASVDIADFLAA